MCIPHSIPISYFFFFFLMMRRPPNSPLFPSPPLSRSPPLDPGIFRRGLPPFLRLLRSGLDDRAGDRGAQPGRGRSEEHTSELQSRLHLVCRLLLEKKKEISYDGTVVGYQSNGPAV